jgi:hypothetical protein
MSLSFEENPMVWVVVQTVEGVEQFVGQHSADLDIMFIPFFKDKEEAQQGLSLIRRAKGSRYEVQAVHIQDLAEDAAQHGFLLFQTDADGQVLDKIDPHTVT